MSIAVVGTSIVDQIIDTPGMIPEACNKCHIKTIFGGSMRNIAENLAHLGQQVSFVTTIGSDALGQALQWHMQQLGITMLTNTIDLPSPFFTSIYHKEDTFRFASVPDAFHITKESQIPVNQLTSANYGITEIASYPALSSLLFQTPHTSWLLSANFLDDLQFQPLYSALFGIVMNEEEAAYLGSGMSYKQLAHSLLEQGMKRIIVTRSDQGVYYLDETLELMMPAIETPQPHYTIGCGDAWIAGYMDAIHQQASTQEALTQGLRAASIKLSHMDVVTAEIAQIRKNIIA